VAEVRREKTGWADDESAGSTGSTHPGQGLIDPAGLPLMSYIRLVADHSIASLGIRAALHEMFSHVGFKLDDETWLDCRWGIGKSDGVRIRPADSIDDTCHYDFQVDGLDEAIEYGATLVGTKYDLSNIAGSVFDTRLHNPRELICSRFVAECMAEANQRTRSAGKRSRSLKPLATVIGKVSFQARAVLNCGAWNDARFSPRCWRSRSSPGCFRKNPRWFSTPQCRPPGPRTAGRTRRLSIWPSRMMAPAPNVETLAYLSPYPGLRRVVVFDLGFPSRVDLLDIEQWARGEIPQQRIRRNRKLQKTPKNSLTRAERGRRVSPLVYSANEYYVLLLSLLAVAEVVGA